MVDVGRVDEARGLLKEHRVGDALLLGLAGVSVSGWELSGGAEAELDQARGRQVRPQSRDLHPGQKPLGLKLDLKTDYPDHVPGLVAPGLRGQYLAMKNEK